MNKKANVRWLSASAVWLIAATVLVFAVAGGALAQQAGLPDLLPRAGSAPQAQSIPAGMTRATTYRITVSASPENGGTVSGGGTFPADSEQTVTATPASGFTFVNWTENGAEVSTSTHYQFTLTAKRNLVAHFTDQTFTIAIAASPVAGGSVSGGGTFPLGSSRTVTAVPTLGWRFINWTEDNVTVSASASYQFTLTADRNLVANFQQFPEFQVNSTSEGDQQESSIAALNDGGFIVVWTAAQQNGVPWSIYGRRYDQDAVPTGDEFLVNSHKRGLHRDAKVAALSDGGFVVVWMVRGQDGSAKGVFGQRYDSAGARAGREFQVNTTTAGDQHEVAVAGLSGGGFVVTWTSFDGSSSGIFGQRFAAGGAPLGSEFAINRYTADIQKLSAVAALSDGGFVIVWVSDREDIGGWEIYDQIYDAAGKAVRGNVKGNAYPVKDDQVPAVAGILGGGYFVMYVTQTERIDGNRFSQFGRRTGRFHLRGNRSVPRLEPQFAFLKDSLVPIITWISPDKPNTSFDVFIGFTPPGPRRPPNYTRVNIHTGGDQHAPAIAVLKNGNAIVTWTSEGQDGSGNGIFARKFEP
jgi:hypothetical protein